MISKYDLSVLIAARNEEFLSRTVEGLLKNKRGKTEVIVILDGAWASPPLESHPDLTIVYHKESIGQRAACNEAAKLSQAKYLMKIDAHCIVDKGFDVKMMEEMQDNFTMIPIMYNLHVFNWKCMKCGNQWYQSPTPKHCMQPAEIRLINEKCDGEKYKRVMVWRPRWHRKNTHYRFDQTLHFQYWGALGKRPEIQAQGDIADSLSLQGSCFMVTRKKWFELNICDEELGSWGQQGTEVACKTWLSGGRVVINKKTWYSHMFRTQGGNFGFPYPQDEVKIEQARQKTRDLFFNNRYEKQIYPFSWLIEKFKPIPDWHDPKNEKLLNDINRKGREFIKKADLPYFRQIKVKCVVCGKKYSVKPSREEKTKCCSLECLGKYKSEIYIGRKMTEEWKKKIGNANTGKNHGLWKGDEVSYKTLHQWVQRYKGKAKKCSQCGSLKNVEWANRSQKYKRDLNDWIELCKKCHWRYDHVSRSIIYYTDNQLKLKIAHACKKKIKEAGLPIFSASLKPMPDMGKNVCLKLKRGYLAYFKQILAALELADTDIVFFCEHDWLYHPSHFEFTPPKKDVFYYNDNWWRLRLPDGFAITYDTHLKPGLCCYRDLAVQHHRKLVAKLEKFLEDHKREPGGKLQHSFSRLVRAIGFEPGTHHRKEKIDNFKAEGWKSKHPIIDIRHGTNLTASKWKQSDFRSPRSCRGWQETDKEIPGWGKNKDIVKLLT